MEVYFSPEVQAQLKLYIESNPRADGCRSYVD